MTSKRRAKQIKMKIVAWHHDGEYCTSQAITAHLTKKEIR